MTGEDPKNDLISFQWDFYERAVKNYSVIMRLLDSADKEEDLFEDIPRLFVEHTSFNTCKAFLREGRSVKESSFTIDGSVIDLNIEQVEKINAGALSPGLSNHVSGFGALFVYPLKRDRTISGFLVLGNRQPMELDPRSCRELEMLCDICNRSLLSGKAFSTPDGKGHAVTIDMGDFPHSFLLVDGNRRICYANPRAKQEFEGAKGLLVGEPIGNIISGIDSRASWAPTGPSKGK